MKLEWKDGDAPRLIGAMQILLHFLACLASGQQPTEEAQAVARKWAEELQAICKRPLTGAYDQLRQAESRVKDREREIADLCRPWTPPPVEQLVLFENGQPADTYPAPEPPGLIGFQCPEEAQAAATEAMRAEMATAPELVADKEGIIEEFSPAEQDAIEAAQARLAEGIAKLEAATLEAVRIAKGSPTVALRHVANQGLGMSDEDRKSVLADLIARGEVLETGKGRSRKVSLPDTPAPCHAGEGGWPGRRAIREKLLWRIANVRSGSEQAVIEQVAEELGVSVETVRPEYLALVERQAIAWVDGYARSCWDRLLSDETRRTALEMLAAGHKPAEVAEAIGQPERAVRDLGEAVLA